MFTPQAMAGTERPHISRPCGIEAAQSVVGAEHEAAAVRRHHQAVRMLARQHRQCATGQRGRGAFLEAATSSPLVRGGCPPGSTPGVRVRFLRSK